MAKATNGKSPLTLDQFQKILMPQIGKMIDTSVNVLRRELTNKIKFLPTTKVYLDSQDKLMGELKKMREVVAFTGQHYEDTNERIDKVLKIDSRL